jgi:hypothetical protein
MTLKGKRLWLEFEKAVACFAAAMDSNARVCHNAKLPDRDTKRPRQRDVWIEAKVCGHFPVHVLVSCKRYARKLHQGDIDTFVGELASSGAHKGVLYAYSGFNAAALEKAAAHGICCCRLFQNEPSEIPLSLSFGDHYCCAAQIQLQLSPGSQLDWGFRTWGDLLLTPIPGEGGLVVDAVTKAFHEAEHKAVLEARLTGPFPHPFEASLLVPASNSHPSFQITAFGRWKVFRSRQEFVLLNGSYSHTTGDFRGSIYGPSIDRLSTHPGPGWEQIDELPLSLTNTTVAVLYRADTRSALLESQGPHVFSGS